MSKIAKFFISIIMLLSLLNIAYAAAFNLKIASIKDQIVVDEVAEFNLTIQNNLDTNEEFTIRKVGYPFWDIFTKPLQNPITLVVPAHASASIILYVDPLHVTSVDTYTLDMGVILQRTGEEQKVPLTIGIKSTEPLISGYIPTVLASASISPEAIDPREEVKIRIVLNNQNPINYTNLTVKIDSNLLKDGIYTKLEPREEKSIEIVKRLDPMTPPQDDNLVVSVFYDERVIVNPIVQEFSVKEYVTQEEIEKEQSFLKMRKGLKVLSNNPNYKGTVKIETTLFKNLFSSTYPRAEVVQESGKDYLVWEVSLGPDKTMAIYITENYRRIVVIAVLALVAVVLYFIFRGPIVVRKGVANVGFSEGGISDAKVVVRVKNRSGSQITNIEVVDHVPHIAHVEKELSIGSMQPHAILQHPKRGLIIKWTIDALEPGDERVLSYRMKSRLSILGEFNLPSASARAKIGNKVIISNSNRVSVGG